MTRRFYEPQYGRAGELADSKGLGRLGLMSNQHWHDDPKRVAFVMSRYKFVAKMFEGFSKVLEVGCGDGYYGRIVAQHVDRLVCTDIDETLIQDARDRSNGDKSVEFRCHDALSGPLGGDFDGVFSLDVIEHIAPKHEHAFAKNLAQSLHERGAAVVGCPSLESQAYASEISRAGHVNCKTGPGLKSLLGQYFHHVFLFSMNDEVVHTGYAPMANYRLALCAEPRR